MFRILLLALVVAGDVAPQSCSATPSSDAGSTQNVQPIVVNAGPSGDYFNGVFTSVTICVPGQSACQTIDGVLVDTGSIGLRVLASAVTLSLPQQADAGGTPVAECGQFLDGFTWGPIQTADIKMAGEQASAVPIQLIGAAGFTNNIPTACSDTGAPENTLQSLGANGILGVGLFREDCGQGCAFGGPSSPAIYFACSPSACQGTAQSLARQLQNPIWRFASDNNGVVIQLQSIRAGGAPSVNGVMMFGIGTQSNNTLGQAKVLTVDSGGNITTVFGGQSYGSSFIDSGSNGIFFLDTATTGLPLCPDSTDFYCPPSPQQFSATNRGANGVTSAVTFTVGNADAIPQSAFAASEVAGPNPGSFDFGLPFFFGRAVFTAIEGQNTPSGPGPYWAY